MSDIRFAGEQARRHLANLADLGEVSSKYPHLAHTLRELATGVHDIAQAIQAMESGGPVVGELFDVAEEHFERRLRQAVLSEDKAVRAPEIAKEPSAEAPAVRTKAVANGAPVRRKGRRTKAQIEADNRKAALEAARREREASEQNTETLWQAPVGAP